MDVPATRRISTSLLTQHLLFRQRLPVKRFVQERLLAKSIFPIQITWPELRIAGQELIQPISQVSRSAEQVLPFPEYSQITPLLRKQRHSPLLDLPATARVLQQ